MYSKQLETLFIVRVVNKLLTLHSCTVHAVKGDLSAGINSGLYLLHFVIIFIIMSLRSFQTM